MSLSQCFCLSLLITLILGLYYKLNWPKRASAVYWLLETLLFPCCCVDLIDVTLAEDDAFSIGVGIDADTDENLTIVP